MSNFHYHLSNAGKKVSLSVAEREKMRNTIEAYMAIHPVRSLQAAPFAPTFISALFLKRAIAFVVMFALFGTFVGISYAAEFALPGDALYALKKNINEPLRGALAVSPEAKVAWAMDVAAARATEAAALAAESKLSTSTSIALQQSLVVHAREAAILIEEQSQRDPSAAAQVAARFEARLAEYERLLDAIDAKKGTRSNEIARAIHREREHVMTLSNADEPSADFAHLHAAAQEGVAAASDLVLANRSALSTTTAAQIALTLDRASGTIAAGQHLLVNDDHDKARGEFKRAIQASERLSVFVKTSAAIHERTGLVITSDSTTTDEQLEAHEVDTAPLVRARKILSPPETDEATLHEERGTRARNHKSKQKDSEHELSIPVPDF